MPRTDWTPQQREEALALYVEHGPHEAGRRTGIPVRTISTWATRSGVSTHAQGNRAVAIAASQQTLTAKKQRIAERLADEIELLLDQLHAETTEYRVLADGTEHRVVEVERPAPTFADARTIMVTLAIAVDKLQILTGAATARVDVVDERRVEEAAAAVLQLVRPAAS